MFVGLGAALAGGLGSSSSGSEATFKDVCRAKFISASLENR